MASILALAGSNSSTSINHKLITYTASLIKEHTVTVLDMHTIPFVMYGEDEEKENGFSKNLQDLKKEISNADGIILSVNEHNGSISAYFKNVLDWLSRIDRDCFKGKKVFLMATSPGKRGGIGAIAVIESSFTRMGAAVITTFSLPEFYTNFSDEGTISKEDLATEHKEKLNQFLTKI